MELSKKHLPAKLCLPDTYASAVQERKCKKKTQIQPPQNQKENKILQLIQGFRDRSLSQKISIEQIHKFTLLALI